MTGVQTCALPICFLIFVSAILKAIDEHPELLRLASSGPGNDHRLGANEAPPAIISVFMGDVIERILLEIADQQIVKNNKTSNRFAPLNNLSYIPKDNSDRNRTSPFAFTGNKFELRMLGSSLSASFANTVISTIIADSLHDIANRLEQFKYLQDVREEAMKIIQELMRTHHRILFSGDGYASAWIDEAKKRGLPNIASFVEAIAYLNCDKTKALFARHHIYGEYELDARSDILYEQYIKTIQVEAKTLMRMVEREVIPAIHPYLNSLLTLKDFPYYAKQIDAIMKHVNKVDEAIDILKAKLHHAEGLTDLRSEGHYLRLEVFPHLDIIREEIDALELILPRDVYPYPAYLELLFLLD